MADSKSQNRHTYIPPHVQQQMAKQLQQTVPKDMRQYVGAFMEQNVVHPQYGNPMAGMSQPGQMTGQPQSYRPVTHLPRQSHYNNQFRKPGTGPTDLYAAADQGQPAQPTSAPAEQYGHSPAPTPPAPHQPYDFIMNPAPPPKKPLPGTGSLLAKAGLVAVGLIVLLIGFNVLKGLVSGPSPLPYVVATAQDQQALIHLVTDAKEQPDISTSNLNFASTASLSLATSQTNTLTYLQNNHKKVSAKQLGLKIDQKIDEQLTTAAAATTYNQTFKEVMQTKLTNYMNDLKTAYNQVKGPNGKQLLSNNYDQAKLLQQQLQSDTTTQ